MKDLPGIGSKVRYTCPVKNSSGVLIRKDSCDGVVIGHFPGYSDQIDGRLEIIPDYVLMKVNKLPPWWDRPNTNKFAPEVSEIELI